MVNRILIVRLSSLGDTALTLPLLFALSEMIPGAHIGWVVDEPFAPLLQNMPRLNRIHVWKKEDKTPLGLWQLVRKIRSENYQISIDPQGLARSAIIPLLSGIPKRVGFKHGPLEGRELSPFLTHCKVAPPPDRKHVSARNLYLGTALGLDMPKKFPVRFPNDPKSEGRIQTWWRLKVPSRRALIFGIGAGWPTKMWAVEEMAILIDKAKSWGYEAVALWGPKEKADLKEWQAQLGNRVLWAPETDIQEMVALLRRCNGYAGPDSAALHLAWLLNKPTFSWFGSSDPARCAPRGSDHAFVARGPHTWDRKKFPGTGGLRTLTGTEVLPAFKKWLYKK